MTNIVIGLISFVAIFGGVLLGRLAALRLPSRHLSAETQSAVTVSVAVIATLAALVLGLMISAAYTSFSARSNEIRQLSLQLIRVDRNLRRYGPEADDARAKLHAWARVKLQQLFPANGQPQPSSQTAIVMLESVQDTLLALSPTNERQKYLQTLCLTLSSQLIQARWALELRAGHSIPVPFSRLADFLAGDRFRQLWTLRAAKFYGNDRALALFDRSRWWDRFDRGIGQSLLRFHSASI